MIVLNAELAQKLAEKKREQNRSIHQQQQSEQVQKGSAKSGEGFVNQTTKSLSEEKGLSIAEKLALKRENQAVVHVDTKDSKMVVGDVTSSMKSNQYLAERLAAKRAAQKALAAEKSKSEDRENARFDSLDVREKGELTRENVKIEEVERGQDVGGGMETSFEHGKNCDGSRDIDDNQGGNGSESAQRAKGPS